MGDEALGSYSIALLLSLFVCTDKLTTRLNKTIRLTTCLNHRHKYVSVLDPQATLLCLTRGPRTAQICILLLRDFITGKVKKRFAVNEV